MIPSAPAPTITSSNATPCALGERRAQRPDAAVGIAVELEHAALHRLERGGERRERPLVRGELDDALQPELALHRLDRLARLVRDETVDRGAEEAQASFSLCAGRAVRAGLASPARGRRSSTAFAVGEADDRVAVLIVTMPITAFLLSMTELLLLSDFEQPYAGRRRAACGSGRGSRGRARRGPPP